jgi:hypothetical protein
MKAAWASSTKLITGPLPAERPTPDLGDNHQADAGHPAHHPRGGPRRVTRGRGQHGDD